MNNKLINIIYRCGGGGEFFGTLLTKHDDVVTRKTAHRKSTERWFIDPVDKQSQEFVDGTKPVSDWKPDEKLWNIRLDHGYGFHVHREYWQNYLWNDWNETKTILLQPQSEDSVRYIDRLMGMKAGTPDSTIVDTWEKNGIDMGRMYDVPWKTCQEFTELYKDMIPMGHDYCVVDPCDLFHKSDEVSEDTFRTILDYLELDDYLLDNWLVKIESYRSTNRKLLDEVN